MNKKDIQMYFIIMPIVTIIVGLFLGLIEYSVYKTFVWHSFISYSIMFYLIQLPLESIKYAYKTHKRYKEFNALKIDGEESGILDWKSISDFEISKTNCINLFGFNLVAAIVVFMTVYTLEINGYETFLHRMFFLISCNLFTGIIAFSFYYKLHKQHVFALGALDNEDNGYYILSTIPKQLTLKSSIRQNDIILSSIQKYVNHPYSNSDFLIKEYNHLIDKNGFLNQYQASCLIRAFKNITMEHEIIVQSLL